MRRTVIKSSRNIMADDYIPDIDEQRLKRYANSIATKLRQVRDIIEDGPAGICKALDIEPLYEEVLDSIQALDYIVTGEDNDPRLE